MASLSPSDQPFDWAQDTRAPDTELGHLAGWLVAIVIALMAFGLAFSVIYSTIA